MFTHLYKDGLVEHKFVEPKTPNSNRVRINSGGTSEHPKFLKMEEILQTE